MKRSEKQELSRYIGAQRIGIGSFSVASDEGLWASHGALVRRHNYIETDKGIPVWC